MYLFHYVFCLTHKHVHFPPPPLTGSTARRVPTGFLFDTVVSPNYTTEILSWIGFALLTQQPVSGVCAIYINYIDNAFKIIQKEKRKIQRKRRRKDFLSCLSPC